VPPPHPPSCVVRLASPAHHAYRRRHRQAAREWMTPRETRRWWCRSSPPTRAPTAAAPSRCVVRTHHQNTDVTHNFAAFSLTQPPTPPSATHRPQALTKAGVEYEEVDANEPAVLAACKAASGMTTVPQAGERWTFLYISSTPQPQLGKQATFWFLRFCLSPAVTGC
jgi:hypothetical protein